MEQYVIRGGNPLVGEVEIGGAKNAALVTDETIMIENLPEIGDQCIDHRGSAKNAALAILTAATMTDETVLIENLPDVSDINVLLEAIAEIGAALVDVHRPSYRADQCIDYR